MCKKGSVLDFPCLKYRKASQKMQYKRPSPRVRRGYGVSIQKVNPNAKGRVADIVWSILNMGVPVAPPVIWTPPNDYKFIAKKLPELEGDLLIARCESWFDAHPQPLTVTRTEKAKVDTSFISALHEKYKDKRPPMEESIAAWRAAGLSEERLAKYTSWWKKFESSSEERQAALNLIFAKYPSANKPTPKVKKVIKAVNKKNING